MSAIEETDTAGKDTSGGGQPSGAASTHTVVTALLPHLAYGDAVHAEVAEWELHPELMEAGVGVAARSGRPELFLRLIWPAGSIDLGEDVRPDGLTLSWSHITGWSARSGDSGLLLSLHEFAAPPVVAEAALHLVEEGLDCGWTPDPGADRWEHATATRTACLLFATGKGAGR